MDTRMRSRTHARAAGTGRTHRRADTRDSALNDAHAHGNEEGAVDVEGAARLAPQEHAPKL
eukprot:964142-Pleurochrysis_carterae.AAC.3